MSTVFNNTLYLSLSSSLALGIAFLFNILLGRFLGVEQFGEFSFVMSFTALFSVLVEFSLDTVLIRDIARVPARAGQYFGNALALKGILFVLTVMLIAVMSHVLAYPAHIRLFLYVLSAALLFDGAKRCCISLFEAAQKMQFPAALLFVERAVFALLGLGAVIVYGTVTAVVLCYVIAQAVTCFGSLLLIRSKLGVRPEGVEYGFIKQLTRYALPFFTISLTAALYADIDKLFLFSMTSSTAVGLYAAAYKLVSIPVQFSNAFHRALYPVLSRHAASRDMRRIADTYRCSMRYLILGAVPIGVGMTVFAEPMIRATYGANYLSGTIALQVLIWAYVLEFFNPFFSRVLYALGKERLVLAAAVVATVLNVVFNVLLIPSYGILGAAIATLISASVIFIILLLGVCAVLPNTSLMKLAVRPVLAGLCMWAFCIFLREMWPIALAVSGIFVYCVCLLLSRAVSSEEVLSCRRVLRAPI